MYITYILVSNSTLLAVIGPREQLASSTFPYLISTSHCIYDVILNFPFWHDRTPRTKIDPIGLPRFCPVIHKVQELNLGTEASFSFFISNIFRSVKCKNIAFRMFWFNFMTTLHE